MSTIKSNVLFQPSPKGKKTLLILKDLNFLEEKIELGKLLFTLTHISLASFLWDICNSAEPDQTPHIPASDQVLHCLLTECSIRIPVKMKNTTQQPVKRKCWEDPFSLLCIFLLYNFSVVIIL